MYQYYQLIKNSKDPVPFRTEMVKYAIENGNKPAAKNFQTTPKTVRKWRKPLRRKRKE
ncbi:MAG: helix-turn-helix domain-containing protein [Spirochaetales bacterium]|nr:helix-turn-helix domain-containing protein [Spirochaetales bacterium]